MIEIKKAIQEDYDSLINYSVEEALPKYPAMKIGDICYSGWNDGKLSAVAGFEEFWDGVWYCWIVISRDVIGQEIQVVRCVDRMIRIVESTFDIVRLQCTIRCDFEKAKDFVEHIGFVCEGRMEKYTPDGKDAWLYARITNGFNRKKK